MRVLQRGCALLGGAVVVPRGLLELHFFAIHELCSSVLRASELKQELRIVGSLRHGLFTGLYGLPIIDQIPRHFEKSHALGIKGMGGGRIAPL